eukprot:3304609-Amphidinium_carterae.1
MEVLDELLSGVFEYLADIRTALAGLWDLIAEAWSDGESVGLLLGSLLARQCIQSVAHRSACAKLN